MMCGRQSGTRVRQHAVAALILTTFGAYGQDLGGLPPGAGQIETFANCTPCHSSMIIMQQRLNRATWDEVLTWMVDEKGMHEMQPEVREKVLDYLVSNFGPSG